MPVHLDRLQPGVRYYLLFLLVHMYVPHVSVMHVVNGYPRASSVPIRQLQAPPACFVLS